ncbi:MAG: hypothetical protein ACFFA7_13230 [Promethearchaeota archaeon]
MIETLICELAFLIISFLCLIYSIKTYRERKNKIDIVIFLFISAIISQSIIRLALMINLPLFFTIGALFNITNIGMLVYVCIELEFLLYLKNAKKFYSLPLVISFYIASGLILYNNGIALYFFALFSGILTFYLLAREGAKNQNGIALSIAIFIIINGSIQTIDIFIFNFSIIGPILRIISITIMLLGASGFIDKHILIDKEKEQNITNIWISKIVTKTNK